MSYGSLVLIVSRPQRGPSRTQERPVDVDGVYWQELGDTAGSDLGRYGRREGERELQG